MEEHQASPNRERMKLIADMVEEAQRRKLRGDPDLARLHEQAKQVRLLKPSTVGPSADPHPTSRIPPWGCENYGGYEHDWMLCPDCLRLYERWLDSEYAGLDPECARPVVRRNAFAALVQAHDLLCCLYPEEAAFREVLDHLDAALTLWRHNPLTRVPE